MATIVEVQFVPWDKIYSFRLPDESLVAGEKFEVNDYIIAETKLGTEIGKLVGRREVGDRELASFGDLKPILRKASSEDLDKAIRHNQEKEAALAYCRELIEKNKLEMKLVDANFSFDGDRLTFAFIADGRVDFRELVKELTRHFQKSIRLQQLGIRDEAKAKGDIGACGRVLCCRGFLKDLKSVTSELADLQQVSHRGSDKLSGICGRLKCCLAFEKNVYEEFAKGLPPIGSIIKIDKGRGQVIGWHTLKKTVDVRLEDGGTLIEVPITM